MENGGGVASPLPETALPLSTRGGWKLALSASRGAGSTARRVVPCLFFRDAPAYLHRQSRFSCRLLHLTAPHPRTNRLVCSQADSRISRNEYGDPARFGREPASTRYLCIDRPGPAFCGSGPCFIA